MTEGVGEVIQPKLNWWQAEYVSHIREEARATRVPLFVLRDLFKILYMKNISFTPQLATQWWAQDLMQSGLLNQLRSITVSSFRWTDKVLEWILESMQDSYKKQYAGSKQDLVRDALARGLEHAQEKMEKEANAGVEPGKYDFEYVQLDEPNKKDILKNGKQIVRFAQTTLYYARKSLHLDKGYADEELLEGGEVMDFLSPEMLALGMPIHNRILTNGPGVRMNLYIDVSGSMWAELPEIDDVRMVHLATRVGEALWRAGLIKKTRLFENHVISRFLPSKMHLDNSTDPAYLDTVLQPIQNPLQILNVKAQGGTRFDSCLEDTKQEPAIIVSDGEDATSLPWRSNILWCILNANRVGLDLWPYVKRRQVIVYSDGHFIIKTPFDFCKDNGLSYSAAEETWKTNYQQHQQ